MISYYRRFSIRRGLLACVLLATHVAWAEQLPIDDFVRHGDYLELKISPDGEHLAARMRHEGTVFLMVMRTADNEVVGGTRPRSNSEIHTVTWVNDERLVYELAEKVPGIDAPRPTGELFGIDIDGGRKKNALRLPGRR